MPYTHKPRMIWITFHLKWNWFHAEGNTLISYYISWNSFCMKIKTEEQKKWAKKREQKSKGTLFVISMSILFMFYTNCKVQRLWNSKLMNWNLRCTSSARVQRITPLIWFQFPFASDLTADSFCCHCHFVCSRDCWDETIFAAYMQCRQKVFFSTSVCSLYLTLDVCFPVPLLSLSISVYLTRLLCIFLHLFLPRSLRLSHSKCKKNYSSEQRNEQKHRIRPYHVHPILSKWIPPLCQFSFGTHFLAILLISFKSVYEQQIRKVNCFPICLFFKFFAKHFPCRLPVQYGAYSFFFADPKHFSTDFNHKSRREKKGIAINLIFMECGFFQKTECRVKMRQTH